MTNNVKHLCYMQGGIETSVEATEPVARVRVGSHVHDPQCVYVPLPAPRRGVTLQHVENCNCHYEPREEVRVRVRELRNRQYRPLTAEDVTARLGGYMLTAICRGEPHAAVDLIALYNPLDRPYLSPA